MTTTVTIKTVDDGKETSFMVNVTDLAQKHVLRTFNVTSDAKVDATKVLCAALIQQMMDLGASMINDRDNPRRAAILRATDDGIRLVEAAQMQLVKANFVQA